MKLTISLLLKNTINLLFFSERKLYGFPQSEYMNTEKERLIMNAFFRQNLIIVPLLGYSTIGH